MKHTLHIITINKDVTLPQQPKPKQQCGMPLFYTLFPKTRLKLEMQRWYAPSDKKSEQTLKLSYNMVHVQPLFFGVSSIFFSVYKHKFKKRQYGGVSVFLN